MPRCKNYLVDIHKFYKFQTFDYLMFGYVQGLRKVLPTMTVKTAINTFLVTFEIDEENYCYEAARIQYYRILNSIISMNEGNTLDDELVI